MSRIHTTPGSDKAPELDPEQVGAFFDTRAKRISELGPLHAVIYQEKQGQLAALRDLAEADCVWPLLALDGQQHLLDIGCGTGRWASRIAPLVASYVGIDFSEGLLTYARQDLAKCPHCSFKKLGADAISPSAFGAIKFDRFLCAGISIYLNEDQLLRMLSGIASVSAMKCRLIFREPVGLGKRLTLRNHWSDELEDEYHAIYRTEGELRAAMEKTLLSEGFNWVNSGDVYTDPSLNNRADTRQRWILLERR